MKDLEGGSTTSFILSLQISRITVLSNDNFRRRPNLADKMIWPKIVRCGMNEKVTSNSKPTKAQLSITVKFDTPL